MKHLAVLVALAGCHTSGSESEPEAPTEEQPVATRAPASMHAGVEEATTVPDGTCSVDADCESGLCAAGVCADATAGHVYLFGTSFQNTARAFDRVLSNAEFASGRDIDLVVYRGGAPSDLVASTDAALSRAASLAGHRTTMHVAATSPALAPMLPAADVLVVYAQPQASNTQLQFLGDEWSLPLDDFARRGGTIIVLDAPGSNDGTAQILAPSYLLSVGERSTTVGTFAYVDAPADLSARRVPLTFTLGDAAVGWSSSTGTNVALGETGHAVVIHRAIY